MSDVLASVAVLGTVRANDLLRQNNWRVNLFLNSVSVRPPFGVRFKAEKDAETEWVRRGMPCEKMPISTGMHLHLNIKGLEDGCSHRHAMPVSNFQELNGLRVSKHTYFPRDTGKYTSIGEYSPVVWLTGNRILLGAVTQVSKGYCSYVHGHRLCVRSKSNRKHDVARYERVISEYSTLYTKTYNFSVLGELSNTDALEIAVQGHVAMMTADQITQDTFASETQKLVVNFIESGRVLSGLVRVAGKGYRERHWCARSKPLRLTFWV